MGKPLHILVVDDRPDGVLFLTEFLLARSHSVETSSNGAEALEAIIRRHRSASAYDLLISDVSMPGMDGIALTKELRRRGILIPVALYTAYGAMHPNLAQDAQSLNCIAVLNKPLELRRVENVINEVSAKRSASGTHRAEKEQPFFGTSRVARPATESTRRSTSTPGETVAPTTGGYALEPRMPSSMPTPRASDMPMSPHIPPPIRTPLPFPIDAQDPTTRSMPSFRTPLPQDPRHKDGTGRTMNPKFRTPLPFLQGDQPPLAPPVIPPQVASAPPLRTPPPAPPTEQDLPFPTTSFVRRSVQNPPKISTGQIRRGTDSIGNPSNQPPGPVTARIRRTVTGSYAPPIGGTAGATPPAAGPTRAVACAHCNKIFMVAIRQTSYTSVCIHCGQMNRIDPM